MSSKRDNSKHNNKKYMRLALNLASQNSGLTGSNPSVGSVIVKNNEIISVIDTTSPEILAPSDLRIEAIHMDENIIELVGVRVFDLVEIASITNDAPEVFPLGETVVTWTATDDYDNSVSNTQTISVIDTTLPEIIS